MERQEQLLDRLSEPLGEMLVKQRKITEADLEKALALQETTGERLGRLLINLGFISEEDLFKTLALQFGLEYLPLIKFPTTPPLTIGIPSRFMERYKVFPLDLSDGVLTVAMANPLDICSIDALRLRTNHRLKIYVGKESDISEAVERYFGTGSSTMERIVDDIPDGELQLMQAGEDEDVDHLRDMAQEAPVIRLVSLVISKAVESKASDIHIEAFENDLKVRYPPNACSQRLSRGLRLWRR
jgi:general secretion pathway protein E